MKETKRRLAAIMFTDMVGYSVMMQKDERTAKRLRNRHREVFSRLTSKYGGEILQYFGDGTLSIFDSSSSSVECALAIQLELKRDPVVPLRIGIHSGEITYGKEDAIGDGVNLAARIESLCVPGGIFLSGKVYDDIKNHATLKAKTLGDFQLKNIQHPIEVFAITNNGISVPEQYRVKKKRGKTRVKEPVRGRKNKFVAGLLALLFGVFGAHRFYLGQRLMGILYMGIALSAMFIVPGMEKLVALPAIVGFIDAVLFFSMSRGDFNARYNKHLFEERKREIRHPVEKKDDQKRFLNQQFEFFYKKALKQFQDYDYEGAIEHFRKAAEIKYDDPELHFLLACCYSVNEQAEKALSSLDTAVAFGYKDFESIHNNDDLAFLRIQPDFEVFVQNNYRMPKELPSPQENLLDPESTEYPDLLEQLNKLQKLWEEGILTKEEYQNQEKKLKSR